MVGLSVVGRLVFRLVGWSVGWLVGLSVGRSVSWLDGLQLVGWSVGWLVDWSCGNSILLRIFLSKNITPVLPRNETCLNFSGAITLL